MVSPLAATAKLPQFGLKASTRALDLRALTAKLLSAPSLRALEPLEFGPQPGLVKSERAH